MFLLRIQTLTIGGFNLAGMTEQQQVGAGQSASVHLKKAVLCLLCSSQAPPNFRCSLDLDGMSLRPTASRASSFSDDSWSSRLSVSTIETEDCLRLAPRHSWVQLPLKLPDSPTPASAVDLSQLVVDPELEDLPLDLMIRIMMRKGA